MEKVTSYKYFGVVFDNRVRKSEHVAFLNDKVRKYICAYRKLSEMLERKEIILAYYAYIQSLLFFGTIPWGGTQKSMLSWLENPY